MSNRIRVNLTNGQDDSCVCEKSEMDTIFDAYIRHGRLIIGSGDFVSVYPEHRILSVIFEREYDNA